MNANQLKLIMMSLMVLDHLAPLLPQQFGYVLFKEPWQAFWGQYYAIIKDVDGNLLSLFCNELEG